MTDPFLMLMLLENLGKGYIVWDKVASIRFKKPGKGRVRAQFKLDEDVLESIRSQADQASKVEPVFTVLITDESGDVVAEVVKTLYVRRKVRPTSAGA
jgi:hypothetical protein